jgi:hypothetical protein
MNLYKALSHLQNLLQKENRRVVINQNDQMAFNRIIEFINTEEKHKNPNNIYFANLYAFVLGHLLDKYDTTIDNKIPHRELHAIINRPFANITEDITAKLNLRLKTRILENAGFGRNKHPMEFTELELTACKNLLRTQLTYAKNKHVFYSDAYTPHEIEIGIRNQIRTNFGYGI